MGYNAKGYMTLQLAMYDMRVLGEMASYLSIGRDMFEQGASWRENLVCDLIV